MFCFKTIWVWKKKQRLVVYTKWYSSSENGLKTWTLRYSVRLSFFFISDRSNGPIIIHRDSIRRSWPVTNVSGQWRRGVHYYSFSQSTLKRLCNFTDGTRLEKILQYQDKAGGTKIGIAAIRIGANDGSPQTTPVVGS